MKVTLIHNPAAGDDRQPSAGQLEALIEEAGHKVRYESTKEKGWTKALKKETDLVVVAGGDGTVAKVARRLIGEKLPLTILPMGTANNISKTLGIACCTSVGRPRRRRWSSPLRPMPSKLTVRPDCSTTNVSSARFRLEL